MHLGGGDNFGVSCKCSENGILTEMKEWNTLCQMKRELSSIHFACGLHANRNESQNCLLITVEDSKTLRNLFRELFSDINQKDELIQNMIRANQKNKENKELQDELLKSQKQIIRNLKEKISKEKIKENPRAENNLLIERCRVLENEVKNLNEKIKQLNEEDEKVRARSDVAFENLFKGLGRGRVDDSVLAIIDGYERKLSKLVRSSSDPRDRMTSPTGYVESPTPNFKLLLKSYESKLESCNKKIKQLQTTNGLLRDQIQSGPPRSVRSGGTESSIKRSLSLNRAVPSPVPNDGRSDRKYWSNFCKKCAEKLCGSDEEEEKEAGVRIRRHRSPNVGKRSSSPPPATGELEKFHAGVVKIVGSVVESCGHRKGRHAPCGDDSCLLGALSHWADQMKQLEQLGESLRNLSQAMHPWRPTKLNGGSGACRVSELIRMVEGMAPPVACGKKCKHDDLSAVEKEQLVGMIDHFQNLFDVPSVEGIVPRMSQLHVKLNENHNVMTRIKMILSLDRKSSSLEVIDKIYRSCRSVEAQGQGENKEASNPKLHVGPRTR